MHLLTCNNRLEVAHLIRLVELQGIAWCADATGSEVSGDEAVRDIYDAE
jgi:hypothetical protein